MTVMGEKIQINLNTIVLILTALGLSMGMVAGFNNVITKVELQGAEMVTLRGSVASLQGQVRATEALAEAKIAGVEARTRSMEIGYAGMSSDVRNILVALGEIKSSLNAPRRNGVVE